MPVTVAEKERHNENEALLSQFRAQMQAVRERRAKVTVTVTTEMASQEIREMRSYCDAVEDPNATRIIEAQLERCREFRLDYPESEYPLD